MINETKLTAGLLTFFFMCFVMYYINSQQKLLSDSIQAYETELNDIQEQYQNIYTQYDSLINIIDNLPLGSPLDTLEI